MTQFVCPCLNVRLCCVKGQVGPVENVNESGDIPLSTLDPFFSQTLYQVIFEKKGISTSQANLLNIRHVDQWTITTCLSCKQDTHASSTVYDRALISPQSLVSDATQIKTLLLSENYSKLYQLILPHSLDNPVSPAAEKTPVKSCQLNTVLQTIRQQAANYLFQEQKEVDERVRAFTEQQYAAYAALQGKVTGERQSLIELITRSCQEQQQKKGDLKMVLPSPFDHFPSPPTSPDNSGSTSSSDLTLLDRHDSRNENLPKAVMKLSSKVPINQRVSNKRSRIGRTFRNGSQLSKSVDANAVIFDMDGLDDEDGGPAFAISDDEEDTDDSTTDEPQMTNQPNLPYHKYASSVPISVPFLAAYKHHNGIQENPTPNDPNQIAASIQALALSMRDDKEMFGDLPRRRLNTGELVKSRPI